ncbi:DnaJ subfamily A member 1, partial [Galemys pyrenaicus]
MAPHGHLWYVFGGRRMMQRERRGKNVVHRLSVNLEDYYNDASIKLVLQKNVICINVKAEVNDSAISVSHCAWNDKAVGNRSVLRISIKITMEEDSLRVKNILEVNIYTSMKDSQKITFCGEGDQESRLEPGDTLIVLDQKDHAAFIRRKEDLSYVWTYNWLKHCVTSESQYLLLTTEPQHDCHLIIELKVNFSENGFFSSEKLLPESEEVENTDEMNQVELMNFHSNQE